MIYRIRVILDVKEDVLRDIEIDETATLEDLHHAVTQAFGFLGNEMASFYATNDEWEQGEEMPLESMDIAQPNYGETLLNTIFSAEVHKLLYIYDFLNLWTFFVELMETAEKDNLKGYPSLIFSHGEVPETPPDKDFVAEQNYDDGEPMEDDLEENDIDGDEFY